MSGAQEDPDDTAPVARPGASGGSGAAEKRSEDAEARSDDAEAHSDDAEARSDDATLIAGRVGIAEDDDRTLPHGFRSAGLQGAGSRSSGSSGSGSSGSGASGSGSSGSGASARGSNPLAEYLRTASGTTGAPVGLDPERRIGEMPARMPWEEPPSPEPGLHQGLPVVYGPRVSGRDGAGSGEDEVVRRVGPPPPSSAVTVRRGREALPSLARRDRRARRATLLLYGAVVLAGALGLWGVARLAFG